MGRADLILLMSLVLAGAGTLAAQATRDAELVAAERAWARAMVDRDLAALDELYADDLVYVHGSGVVETKAEFLKKLSSGERRYHRIDTMDPRVHRLVDDAGVVTDLLEVDIEAGGDRFTVRVRTVNVFARQDGRWKLTVHQATRLAAP